MNKTVRNSAVLTFFAVAVIAGMFALTQVNQTLVQETIKQREWRDIPVAGPSPKAVAAAGVSGPIQIVIYPHWANGSYFQNLSMSNAYAYQSTNVNTSLTGDVPKATTFDILIKCRWARADVVNGTVLQLGPSSTTPTAGTWVRANLTCPQLAIGALTAMALRNITNQNLGDPIDGYVWFYLNNSGAGYTIGADVHFNCTAVKIQLYS